MPAIIGVMGSTDSSTTFPAYLLGHAIATQGAILLTGGAAPPAGCSSVVPGATVPVKSAAVCGALAAKKAGAVARVITIQDDDGNPGGPMGFHFKWEPGEHSIVVETRLRNHIRNYINGSTPDAIIALDGGPGTLSEVAFARFSGVPVTFVNTTTRLAASVGAPVTRIVTAAVGHFTPTAKPGLTPAVVTAALGLPATWAVPVAVTSQDQADGVIASVVMALKPGVSRFPQIPGDPMAKPLFDSLVSLL